MDEFDNVIGLERLKLFHINDSRNGPGTMIDRHDHPGSGLIGLKPLSFFLKDSRFSELPFLLETPKGRDKNGVDLDLINIKILKGIKG